MLSHFARSGYARFVRTALLAATLAAAALAASSSGAAVVPACKAAALRGDFASIYGSAGAGSISYALRLTNSSAATCFVSGLPVVQLLGKTGKLLPSHSQPAFRGAGTAVMVVLKPHASAWASARFSPDVPGKGEPVQGRQCEPTAYKARVTVPPARGTVVAPVRPPTPVCEHGSMSLSLLSSKRPTA
jgi:hypothetical protein